MKHTKSKYPLQLSHRWVPYDPELDVLKPGVPYLFREVGKPTPVYTGWLKEYKDHKPAFYLSNNGENRKPGVKDSNGNYVEKSCALTRRVEICHVTLQLLDANNKEPF